MSITVLAKLYPRCKPQSGAKLASFSSQARFIPRKSNVTGEGGMGGGGGEVK